MRNLFLGIVFLGASVISPVAAQPPTDGIGTKRAVEPLSIAGQSARYRVADMCSIAGDGKSCATIIQVNNLRANSTCNVGVEFNFGGNVGGPACTLTYGSLNPKEQITLCSRDIGRPESCNVVCNPPLTFNSGYATIYSTCSEIGIQATIVTTNADDSVVTSRSSVNLVALPPPLRTLPAGRGD